MTELISPVEKYMVTIMTDVEVRRPNVNSEVEAMRVVNSHVTELNRQLVEKGIDMKFSILDVTAL